MPRTCTVCSNEHRADIEGSLVRGDSLRSIAERSATSPWALMRHRNHMGASLGRDKQARETAFGSDLLDRLHELDGNARRALARAEQIAAEEGQPSKVVLDATKTALLAIREHARQIELVGKLRGELRDGVTVNVRATVAVQSIEAMSVEERKTRLRNALVALERQQLATGVVS